MYSPWPYCSWATFSFHCFLFTLLLSHFLFFFLLFFTFITHNNKLFHLLHSLPHSTLPLCLLFVNLKMKGKWKKLSSLTLRRKKWKILVQRYILIFLLTWCRSSMCVDKVFYMFMNKNCNCIFWCQTNTID